MPPTDIASCVKLAGETKSPEIGNDRNAAFCRHDFSVRHLRIRIESSPFKSGAESLPSELPIHTPSIRSRRLYPRRRRLAGPESIEVSWQRSPEADTAGYYVYRSVDGGAFERLGDKVTLPAFSDRKVEHGKTYRYQISAVDQKKNESDRSAVVEVRF